MADDIDIEEHDVLDNPRIKNIFPDLTRIKVEVPDSDDEDDHHMQTDYYNEPRLSSQNSLQFKHPLHNNHILLGSKRIVDLMTYEDSSPIPDNHFNEEHFEHDANVAYEYDDIQIKQEVEDSHDEEIERHGSCIILGSKPNRTTLETEARDVYSSVVMLEDWGPKLLRSNCYCKDCEILFPTRNCLDAHNMATHSFLVALSDDPDDSSKTAKANVSVNKAMKSTAKNINFSTGSTLSEPSTSKEKFCNHCNKTFPSKAALIAHLYENLTMNKFPCDKCDRIFNKEPELLQHFEAHHGEDEEDEESSDESKDGLYYQCEICSCYFRRYFSRHMLKAHGMITFSEKRVPFNGVCKFCGSMCSTDKYFNRHIRLTHSQYYSKSRICKAPKSSKGLKSKITQHVGSANASDIRRPSFRCLKCNEVFAAYYTAKRHKKIKHPEMLNRKIFVKIKRSPVAVLMKRSTKKSRNDKSEFVYNGVTNPPIPKSVLFQCNKCPLHFTNCTDAVFHAYRCVKETNVWDCDACGKSFKSGDKIIHKRQHIVSDRFVVYLTNHNVYGRTLCQCPNCEIYYSEQEFWVHVKQGCSQPRSAPCNICDILIHVSSTVMHKKLHKNEDFSTKDLILIEFVPFEKMDSENEENVSIGNKRKILDKENASDSKKSKFSSYNTAVTKEIGLPTQKIMYYCEECKNYWRALRVNAFHFSGKCARRSSRLCKKCGLFCTSKYHDMMMHKSGYTIFDFTFIRVQDNKVINPMPSYPRCSKCKTHYLNRRVAHVCHKDHRICEYCQLKFSESAYALHVAFHEYAIRKQSKTDFSSKAKGSQAIKELATPNPSMLSVNKTPSGKSPLMPELLKKYELMTNTWNILYSCEVCDIVCDSYDKMVEHSQDHFNKMESYDMSIENCEICDLRFDATCYDRHKDMHDENATLDKHFFNVLKYNYINLFSDDWFELFGTLPRNQIEQIVSQSIYRRDRNIRMRITRQGPAENTVYKCGRCNGYLTASMVGDHFEMSNCWSPCYKCKLCHLDFSMNVCLKEHQSVCRTTHQSYKEVLFNDANDDTFNRGLQMTGKSDKSLGDITHIESKDALFKIYKCEVCQCCVSTNTKLKNHKCTKPSEKVTCGKCGLYFKSKYFFRHKPLHIKFPKLSKKNIMMIPFKPESYKVLPKLYKCQCGLHFTSLQTAEKHLTVCKPGYQISKENCSKCGLLFPTSVLVSHLCSHHSNDKRTEFNIHNITPKQRGHSLTKGPGSKPITKAIVHKCAQCDLCFLTRGTLGDHFTTNHKVNMDIQHCYQCDVNFTKYSMTRHIQIHHKVRHITRAELKIKVYQKIGNVITEQSTSDDNVNAKSHTIDTQEKFQGKIEPKERKYYSRYLYKCDSCNIHFLSVFGCRTHHSRYHGNSKNAKQKNKNCKECGLAFAAPSLVRHTEIHHKKMKLKQEDFIIITQSGQYAGNALYKCDRCDVCFLTHNGYLKHCAKGLHWVGKIACNVCGYYFTTNKIHWHMNIHHVMKKMSRRDFKIITTLFESQPLQYSKTKTGKIPKRDVKTPTYKSIVTNRLYKCRTCSVHFCKEKDLINHVSEAATSCHNNNAVKCQYCHLEFTPGNDINRHTDGHHKKLKLAKEFLIIENDIIDGAYASRYLYKCNKCNTNFVSEDNAELHDHAIRKSKCRLCGLMFSSDELVDHKNSHHNLMNLSLEDFHFVDICGTPNYASSPVKVNNKKNPKTKYNLSKRGKATINMSKYDNTIFKCSCGVHYLTLRTFKGHLQVCKRQRRTSATRVACKNCGCIFSPYSLSFHQYIQHERLKLKLKDFRILTEKDLIQSDNSSSENQQVESDVHDATSIIETISKGQQHTLSNNADESENNESSSKMARVFRTSFKYSKSYLRSLDMNQFSNQLYKCHICHKHYITLSAAVKHLHDVPGEECAICGLLFTSHIILKHKYVHHEKLGLTRDDLLIQHGFIDNPGINNYLLYKCDVCDMHFIKFTSAHSHTEKNCAMAVCEEDLNCEHCGLRFYTDDLYDHKILHHEKRNLLLEDFNIIHYSGATRKSNDNVVTEDVLNTEKSIDFDESEVSEKADESEIGDVTKPETSSLQMDLSLDDLDSNVSKANTTDSSMSSPRKNLIKLYKCGDCNVFYITQNTCYKHVLNHKPLDSMEYIECKLCGLQFRILTLHKHMIKHHKSDFNLKNVLIEEYQNTRENTPKLDIYYALDKVQSRLVSTTTDSKDVSEGKVDSTVKDAVDPVSNQENTENDSVITELKPTATNSTAEKITSPETEDKAKNSSPAKEEIKSKSPIKLVLDPVTDDNDSLVTCNVNSHPSTDQIVTTSIVKNDSDTAIDETLTKTNVKDVIDHVVELIMTENTVESNSNSSAKETTCSNI